MLIFRILVFFFAAMVTTTSYPFALRAVSRAKTDGPKRLPHDLVDFFSGDWTGSGEFASGKNIEADVNFTEYGGMQASDIKRLRELEEENRRLKQISADLLLEKRALKDVIAKSCNAGGQARTGGGVAKRAWTQRTTRLRCCELNLNYVR